MNFDEMYNTVETLLMDTSYDFIDKYTGVVDSEKLRFEVVYLELGLVYGRVNQCEQFRLSALMEQVLNHLGVEFNGFQ